jgi:hypothetical protein
MAEELLSQGQGQQFFRALERLVAVFQFRPHPLTP